MSQAKVFGIHAAQAALDYSAGKIKRAWVDHQRQDKRLMPLLDALNNYQIPVVKADRKKLDALAEGKNHQGIILDIQLPGVRTEADLKSAVQSLDTPAFFLVLDQVQDPHNLGACLRTADAVGADGIIIPKDNSAGITSTVCKVASGAAETVPVYQVVNLARTLRWLKQQQIWIFGSSGDSEQSVFAADLTLPLALIMGTEGTGMRHNTAKQCDFLVKIPMQGTVESLNVSVAAGIMMYEVRRQRGMS